MVRRPQSKRPADHLPPHVLERSDFVDACARRDAGAVLRLAKQYGGQGFTASHLARRCELTVSRVSDYIHGRVEARSVDVLARISDGLHIPGPMLHLAPRPWEDVQPSDQRGQVDVLRRDFLKTTAAVAVGGVLGGASSSSGTPRIDAATIDAARDRMARLRKLDDHLGGADTYEMYRGEVDLTARTLHDGTARSESVRLAMLLLLAEQMQQCGWAAFDAGWQPQAADLFARSFDAAKEGRSADLAGNALALRSYQLVSTGQAGVDTTNRSFRLADRADTHPVVRSLLYQRGAWTHAIAGDAPQVLTALTKAEDALGVDRATAAPDTTSTAPYPCRGCWPTPTSTPASPSRPRPLRAGPSTSRPASGRYARTNGSVRSWRVLRTTRTFRPSRTYSPVMLCTHSAYGAEACGRGSAVTSGFVHSW